MLAGLLSLVHVAIAAESSLHSTQTLIMNATDSVRLISRRSSGVSCAGLASYVLYSDKAERTYAQHATRLASQSPGLAAQGTNRGTEAKTTAQKSSEDSAALTPATKTADPGSLKVQRKPLRKSFDSGCTQTQRGAGQFRNGQKACDEVIAQMRSSFRQATSHALVIHCACPC